MNPIETCLQKVCTALSGRQLNNRHILYLENIVSRSDAAAIFKLLDHNIYPLMKKIDVPIPADSITSLKKNYTEKLGKAIKNTSLSLNSRGSKGFKIAKEIGLISLLNSAALRQAVEAGTGKKLQPGPGMQVLCYADGDYVSPHNDHHPEEPHLKNGYIDVHLMFSNDYVAHQFLIAQDGNHLNHVEALAVPSSLAIYQLPFWHQVTPLKAKPKQEAKARRWLIMASYCIID